MLVLQTQQAVCGALEWSPRLQEGNQQVGLRIIGAGKIMTSSRSTSGDIALKRFEKAHNIGLQTPEFEDEYM